MNADRACVAPSCHLLLGVVTRERDVVIGFAPIHVARRGRVAFLNVEATRVAHVPVVVPLNEVGLEGPVCRSVGRATVAASLGDVVGKSRTPTSLATGSTAPSIISASTPSATTAATVRETSLRATVSSSALISDVSWKIGK